jgi:hypothetical protein
MIPQSLRGAGVIVEAASSVPSTGSFEPFQQ